MEKGMTIFFEGIITWIFLHICFGENIKIKIKDMVFLCLYWTAFFAGGVYFHKDNVFIIVLLGIFIWSKIVFNKRIITTILKDMLSVFCVSAAELVAMFFFDYVTELIREPWVICLVMSLSALMITFVIYRLFSKYNMDTRSFKIDVYEILMIVTLFLFFLITKIRFELQRTVELIYVAFFVSLIIVWWVFSMKQKQLHKLEQDKVRYELQELYGKAYQELLNFIRRRQHDYKNQLLAVSSTSDDVRQSYMEILKNEDKYDSILTKCANPVIAGYLYNLLLKYNEGNIRLNASVNVASKDISVRTKDTIEAIGILVNNAYEQLAKFDKNSEILLSIEEVDTKIIVEVTNELNGENLDIGKLFGLGESTKGEGRGVGLYALRKISDKYYGEIHVEPIKIKEATGIKIKLII